MKKQDQIDGLRAEIAAIRETVQRAYVRGTDLEERVLDIEHKLQFCADCGRKVGLGYVTIEHVIGDRSLKYCKACGTERERAAEPAPPSAAVTEQPVTHADIAKCEGCGVSTNDRSGQWVVGVGRTPEQQYAFCPDCGDTMWVSERKARR